MAVEQGQQLAGDQERCLERLNWAIQELDGQADPVQLEKTAELIIQTMTGPWRYFHTPEHIFEVGHEGDAIEVLSALFHDLVYVQVDQGVSVNISRCIAPFVKEVQGQLIILERSDLPIDPLFEMVMQIFNFKAGQSLIPTAGQNEFLSAVIAAKSLEHALSMSAIAQIAVCIETTIPFRSKSEAGLSPSDRLYERLKPISQAFKMGWSETDLVAAVQRAVRMANRDIENFAYSSSADFLDNTWNLLPETNHDLKNANSYTVNGYRVSMQKMEGFMYFLKPELVFQQFRNEPDEAFYQQQITQTQKNLEVARLYLGSKLLSIAVIEALSQRIGKDIPLATMMGELPSMGRSIAQLENFLPQISVVVAPETTVEWEVLNLLEKGRTQTSSYDIKNSPVATFIIKSIGFPEARRLLTYAKSFFKGELGAEEFLERCDRHSTDVITEGVVQVFENRRNALRGVSAANYV
jgi:hypothetical protein